MNKWGYVLAASFVLAAFVAAWIAWRMPLEESSPFNADSANKLAKSWNWRDKVQLSRIERKIKRRCKRGNTELVLMTTPRPRVVELLKNQGYQVTMGNPSGAVIKW